MDDAALEALFTNAGVSEKSTVVVYCGTGIWATVNYIVAKHLGYDVKFYDGSFEEWSADPNLLIAEPVDPRLLN